MGFWELGFEFTGLEFGFKVEGLGIEVEGAWFRV